jgi:mRNA-degrading endonuclease RelE of RelBE toxin-antitoxin system
VDQKSFEVVFSPSAQRDIAHLEPGSAVQLVRDINSHLAVSPLGFRKTRIKKLSGFNPPLYRLRSGDFRAYYRIVGKRVVILAITHKKDSERRLKLLT